MSNFIRIVRNYENICRIGREIINHKDFVRRAAPDKLDEEFRKQEERIEEFMRVTDEAHKELKKSPYAVNPYWTGLS